MVYLLLQLYRQSTFKRSGAEKLKPYFYGPYRIIRHVGEVAYEIELPSGSRIHNVFHVSCLKRVLGQHIIPSPDLGREGTLVEKQGDSRVFDSRERSPYRGRHLGVRDYFTASNFAVACGQPFARGEDFSCPLFSSV